MANPIDIQKVRVRLQKKTLIEGVTWSAKRGQINAIIGPNGAGKSTLLKAIAGLIPHDGHVQVEGKNLSNYTLDERARSMAWVPQDSMMQLPLTVEELVAQGRFAHLGPIGRLAKADHDVIHGALSDVNCLHLKQRTWSTLSGGEKRRVMIARGLATGSNILLLDEPIASLDIEHALRVMELMRALADKGYTLVPVLHDLELAARYADNILLMNDGRVFAYGAANEVLSADNVRHVYRVDMQHEHGLRFQLGDHA